MALRHTSPEDSETASIQKRLRGDLVEANERYAQAEKAFTDIVSNVPSGIPSPDGTLRIRQISEERRTASEAYRKASERYSDFVLRGIIPQDSEEPVD